MDPAEFVPLGRIVKTHGLAGEVSVIEREDRPLDLFVGENVWFVPPPARIRTSVIVSVRPGPKGPLVKLRGVDGPDDADALRGTTILASASVVEAVCGTAEEEPDPVGLLVTDEERGVLGTVAEVIVTGANDVWVIEGGPFGQVLIPVIDPVVLAVDWDAMTATVRLLPGLLDGD